MAGLACNDPHVTRLVSRTLRSVIAKSAALLIRTRSHRWCPPALSLRIYRRQFGGGRPDWSPTPGGLGYRATDGSSYGVDAVGTDPAVRRPVVIWVHGGGWFFGTRGLVTPYLEELAKDGVAGLALSYPLAPEARHPEPLQALNDGIGQLLSRADELGIDPDRVVLAGDSAGAALALALASAAADPDRASTLGLAPTLSAAQVRGLILCCGVFQPSTIAEAHPWYSEPMLASLVSLAGVRRWEQHRVARDFDGLAIRRLPPTLVVSAENDPLHAGQSAPFVTHLDEAGIDVTQYVAPHRGGGHEFQFELQRPAAQEALSAIRVFLAKHLS